MRAGYYLLVHPNLGKAQYGYPRRTNRHNGELTGGIVLHSTEGVTDLVGADLGAENVAAYISRRDKFGSYHDITDRDSVVPMLPYEYEAWHDTSSNNFTTSVAVAWRKADLRRMTRAQRGEYYDLFARRLLHQVEWYRREKGITVPIDRFKTRKEIMAGESGITTHSRMDPDRRSDPFGTGSRFEKEFLADLHKIAGGSNPFEEDEMSVDNARIALAQMLDEAANRSTPTGRNLGDDLTVVIRSAVWAAQVHRHDGDVSALQELADAKTAALQNAAQIVGLREALSQTSAGRDVDYERIEKIVVDAVPEMLDVTVTVDTPKEETS